MKIPGVSGGSSPSTGGVLSDAVKRANDAMQTAAMTETSSGGTYPAASSGSWHGNSKSDYRYTGSATSLFKKWVAGDVSTYAFQSRTRKGDGTSALVLDSGSSSDSGSDTPIADRTGGPIGSDSLEVGVDPETGDASEIITGGGGSSTTDAKRDAEDTTTVGTVTSGGSSSSLEERARQVEQAVENATDGAAFGGDVVDSIGSGSAVETVAEAPQQASERAQEAAASARSWFDSVGTAAVGAAVLVVVAAVALLADGDGGASA